MAIAIIADLPGGTAEFDDSMTQRLNLAGQPPAGAIARFAGPTESGWRVISVWESEQAWETFRRERLEPALRQASGQVPQFQRMNLHSVRLMPQQ